METITLNAQVRGGTKKGPARRLRTRGITPAVVYGAQRDPLNLQISSSDLKRVLEKVRKETVFIKLAIDDAGTKSESLSILKDIQVNALKKEITHADFYEINLKKPLTIDVPVLLTGTAPGIEKGGEVIMMKRDLKVSGLPSDLPETVEVDVSALDLQESVRVGDITMKDGITLIDGDDVVIAHVGLTRAAMAAAGEQTEAADAKVEEGEAGDSTGEE
jgi:large subunit ribosomal protein L25